MRSSLRIVWCVCVEKKNTSTTLRQHYTLQKLTGNTLYLSRVSRTLRQNQPGHQFLSLNIHKGRLLQSKSSCYHSVMQKSRTVTKKTCCSTAHHCHCVTVHICMFPPILQEIFPASASGVAWYLSFLNQSTKGK